MPSPACAHGQPRSAYCPACRTGRDRSAPVIPGIDPQTYGDEGFRSTGSYSGYCPRCRVHWYGNHSCSVTEALRGPAERCPLEHACPVEPGCQICAEQEQPARTLEEVKEQYFPLLAAQEARDREIEAFGTECAAPCDSGRCDECHLDPGTSMSSKPCPACHLVHSSKHPRKCPAWAARLLGAKLTPTALEAAGARAIRRLIAALGEERKRSKALAESHARCDQIGCPACTEAARLRGELEALREREPTRGEMEAAIGDLDETVHTGWTVRRCIDCRAPIAGGPTRCILCVGKSALDRADAAEARAKAAEEKEGKLRALIRDAERLFCADFNSCPECDGTLDVSSGVKCPITHKRPEPEPCPECDGTGRAPEVRAWMATRAALEVEE